MLAGSISDGNERLRCDVSAGMQPIVKMNLMADEHIIGEGMRGEQINWSWKLSALVYETTCPKAWTAC